MNDEDAASASREGTSLTLLDRIRASDQEAWRQLVYLYTPLVVHWCRRRGVREAEAEDVAQEVFRAVAAGIDGFRHDRPGDTFRGWLRAVTHRKVLDWRRYVDRQPAVAAGGTEAGEVLVGVAEGGADEDDDPQQMAGVYRRSLELVRGEFEPATWQAFWRVAVDGIATAEVARELGISTASVRQSKSRVLRRLREGLGEVLA